MRRTVFICFLLIQVWSAQSKSLNADSLLTQLDNPYVADVERLFILATLCDIYQYRSVEKYKKYAQEGLMLAIQLNDSVRIADFNKNMGVAYVSLSATDSALMSLEEGLRMALQTENKKCEAMIYNELGHLHLRNFQYRDNEKALTYYLKALKLCEELGDKEDISFMLCNVAQYHRLTRNKERAAYYLQKANDIAEEIDSDFIRAYVYYNLEEVVDDVETATPYSLMGLELAKKINHKSVEALLLQAVAFDYCLEKKEYDIAERYALECLQVAEEYGGSNELICAWTVLSFVYLYQKRFQECKEMVLNAWHKDSLHTNLATLTNLAAAHLYLGELDEAHTFFVKYVHIMEANAGRQFQQRIADMDVKYETEKKELQIASLEKEKQLYFGIIVGGVLFSLSIIFLLLQTVKNNRKKRQLIATRSVMDGEMKERTRLARDLHDRLSGNLSAIKIDVENLENQGDVVVEKLDTCIEEVRRVAHGLMPASLQHGLKSALEDYVVQFPNVSFHFFGEEQKQSERTEYLIYCCASELVNNSLRHSGATLVDVQLVQDEKQLTLTVQDNGSGYDEKQVTDGMGLQNIRDRVMAHKGRIDVYSSPGKGTETTIEIKIE